MDRCSQYYPWAGKTDPCSGNVHNLQIKNETIPNKPITVILVCDGHMPSFIELCERPNYLQTIVIDEIIGEIAPTEIEGKPVKEKE